MPGPPRKNPDERVNARRLPEVQLLPSEGRTAGVPDWPLPVEPSSDEWALWERLWVSVPAAVMWERMGHHTTVARYCWLYWRSREPRPPTGSVAEARQLEESLGLTPKGLQYLQWRVAADEVGELRERRPSARERKLAAVKAEQAKSTSG